MGRRGRWDTRPSLDRGTSDIVTLGPRVPGSQQSGVRGADAGPGGLPGVWILAGARGRVLTTPPWSSPRLSPEPEGV